MRIPKAKTPTATKPTRLKSRRFGGTRTALLVSVALVLLVGSGIEIGAQSNLELYRRLAVDLMEEAHQLGDDEDARRELARRAADLDPTLGDAFVILAGYLEGEQDAQRQRERFLSQALSGEFVTIAREDAVGDMVDLLLQQNRASEAVNLLEAELSANGTPPVERILGYVSRGDQDDFTVFRGDHLSRLDRLYITALMDGDAPWFVGRLMQRLRSRFPMDQALGSVDWRRASRVSLGVLEWIDAVEQLTGTVPAEMYRELLTANPPESLVPTLIGRYHRAGGEDPLIDALAAVHGVESFSARDALLSDKRMWELFVEHLDRSDLPDPIERAMEELRRQERAVLRLDVNRDGYSEESYTYVRGELSFWQSDQDQDGRASIAVRSIGPAVRIAARRESEEGVIVIDYGSYPLVSRVRWISTADGTEWTPSRPVPFDVGLSAAFEDDLWNSLGRRVTVNSDILDRFERQRDGDDSRALGEDRAREQRLELQQWGMIE